jgi:hypothetical protein
MNINISFWSATLATLTVAGSLGAASLPETAPQFQEVYEAIRTNFTSVSPAELNRLAVAGLLRELGSRATLLTNANGAGQARAAAPLERIGRYDEHYGYFRVSQVGPGLAMALQQAGNQMSNSNRLQGMIIDLRFAGGNDYREAAAVADLFHSEEKPLLAWGETVVRSHAKTNFWNWPLMVLINQRTQGAAEALAGTLREAQYALLLGSDTAGQAGLGRDVTLSHGQVLRLLATPVRLASGTVLGIEGLKPDIKVEVSAAEEMIYWRDPYQALPYASAGVGTGSTNTILAGTNRMGRSRINEAELVRMKREGEDLEDEGGRAVRGVEDSAKPVVRDPVLARALDLLKALAVVSKNPLRKD